MRYKKIKEEDWNYFCSKINWGDSALDARAIQIMNQPLVEEDD